MNKDVNKTNCSDHFAHEARWRIAVLEQRQFYSSLLKRECLLEYQENQ